MTTVNIVGARGKQYAALIENIFSKACRIVRCPKSAHVSVVFVGDAKMRTLNRKYRHKDKTTNVLSFNAEGNDDLGDIFISYPEAMREAKKYGWTVKYEIARLTLHGFLHLLGYDHEKENEAKMMEGIEERILQLYA